MDTMRGFEDEGSAFGSGPDEEAVMERPPAIGSDERRMHVRAYNYWVSLLEGRPFPSIGDVDPGTVEDFGENSVLLDFTRSSENPEISFLGSALRAECDIDRTIKNINQVPARSLLSRLTDHYLQIIANRAPIGFEAEFVGQRGLPMMYRGILMPLSSNGDAIDFIYGVINWKELADSDLAGGLAGEVDRAVSAAPAVADCAIWADGPHADFDSVPEHDVSGDNTLDLWPDDDHALPTLDESAGLADRLCVARASAEQALHADQRSRAALYRAIGQAYDFALATADEPDTYAELLEDAGIKAQTRAPMTPIVKLIFGVGYDKTRLTEFATALGWASRQQLEPGQLAERLEQSDGGLKAIVQEERRARRPAPQPDRWDALRADLLARRPLASVDVAVPGEEGDFVLLIARREAGQLDIVAPVNDAKLIEQAIRKSA
jgi:hypothetical protein